MTIKDKNMSIAEMLGADKENWYTPNKDAGTTGDYYVFPTTFYNNYANGEKIPYRWYPDNVRQHGDNALKFHSDANWQYQAMAWAEKKNFLVDSRGYDCLIESNDGDYSESSNCMVGCSYSEVGNGNNRMEAVFEALFKLSQYLKK